MKTKLRDKVLSIGERIHPLMGPIFTGRPDSSSIGDPCAMCTDDTPAPSDTVIRRKNGTKAYLCLDHDLMLHQAARNLDGVMNDYEQRVLAQILDGAGGRPFWMPIAVYLRLVARAQHWAHVWTLHIFSDLTQRIFEQREQELNDELARLRIESERG
ncbi:hypothetical protein GCM10027417_24060 [Glutamicibacter endophyticus]